MAWDKIQNGEHWFKSQDIHGCFKQVIVADQEKGVNCECCYVAYVKDNDQFWFMMTFNPFLPRKVLNASVNIEDNPSETAEVEKTNEYLILKTPGLTLEHYKESSQKNITYLKWQNLQKEYFVKIRCPKWEGCPASEEN